ncbi:MAG: spore coat protein [Bacillota bacterium]|nr:spore coat protein [Bacillota bacterium]
MMAANYGAHEVMEVHEVLTKAIDVINLFQLYQPFVKDPELKSILQKQLEFTNQEYFNMVQAIGQQGMGSAVPYRNPRGFSPSYGLQNPAPQAPNASMNEMDDRDVASGMLGCHKASASMKMIAALECADPNLRQMIQQGANNCADQAYEVWQYMNAKGYYQIPTMQQTTTNNFIDTYNAPMMAGMMTTAVNTGLQQNPNMMLLD